MSDQWPEGEDYAEMVRFIDQHVALTFARMDIEALERLLPDECSYRGLESRTARCYRPDHPTPESDCTVGRRIPHITEEPH